MHRHSFVLLECFLLGLLVRMTLACNCHAPGTISRGQLHRTLDSSGAAGSGNNVNTLPDAHQAQLPSSSPPPQIIKSSDHPTTGSTEHDPGPSSRPAQSTMQNVPKSTVATGSMPASWMRSPAAVPSETVSVHSRVSNVQSTLGTDSIQATSNSLIPNPSSSLGLTPLLSPPSASTSVTGGKKHVAIVAGSTAGSIVFVAVVGAILRFVFLRRRYRKLKALPFQQAPDILTPVYGGVLRRPFSEKVLSSRWYDDSQVDLWARDIATEESSVWGTTGVLVSGR